MLINNPNLGNKDFLTCLSYIINNWCLLFVKFLHELATILHIDTGPDRLMRGSMFIAQ